MQILKRELSPKTAILVSQIEQSLHSSIYYLDVSMRPNMKDIVFGTVDVHPNDGIYKVWLQSALPQDPFEADLLHELRHIVQIKSGYPEVCNKNTAEFYSEDRSFIQEVGSHLSSVILDIDVNIWLIRNGYSYEYFSSKNVEGLLRNKDYRYTMLDDSLNFANLSCALLNASLFSNKLSIQKICDAYSAYPEVIRAVSDLYDKLSTMTIDNPKVRYARALCGS